MPHQGKSWVPSVYLQRPKIELLLLKPPKGLFMKTADLASKLIGQDL